MVSWLRGDKATSPAAAGRGAVRLTLLAAMAALLVVGPAFATDTDCDGTDNDDGGYVCTYGTATDNVPDISATGTAVSKWPAGNSDDGYYSTELPAGFTWYGTEYTEIYISTNGYVTFSSTLANREMASVSGNPNTAAPNAAIYGYGDDLTFASTGTLYYDESGTCTGDYNGDSCFIVQWDQVPVFGDSDSRVTLQIALNFDENVALVEVEQEDNVDSANVPNIVGTENADGTIGLWYLGAGAADSNSGSVTAGDNFVFMVDAGADITAPNVSSTTPTNGATYVALAQDVVVNFDEAMATGSVTLTVEEGVDPGDLTPAWTNGDATVTYTHSDFAEADDYTLSIVGTDVAGNALDYSGSPVTAAGGGPAGCGTTKYCWSFTTTETDAPAVSSTTPTNGATDVAVSADVVANFDEAMSTGSVTLTVETGTDPGDLSPTWSNGDQTVTYTHSDFDEATVYTLSLVGTDLAGNALDYSASPVTEGGGGPAGCGTTKYCWSFTTDDTTAPSATQKQTTTSADLEVTVEWDDLPTGVAGGPDGVLVLQALGTSVTDAPTDGVTYSLGDSIGSATVACIAEETDTACTDQFFVSNGNTYYYKSFVYDAALNYSSGTETAATPKATSSFDWAYLSQAAILNPVVPIPNQSVVGIGNDKWLHVLGSADGLRDGWTPPVVGAAVQDLPNAVDLNPGGAADYTAFVAAQDGYLYRFDLASDGTAENSIDVIDTLDTAGTACTGFGILQAAPIVLFDSFASGNVADDDLVIQATRCGSADNAVVMLDHSLSVVDVYTDTAADGGTTDSNADGLGISNALPAAYYSSTGNQNVFVYVPLRSNDAEDSSLVVLEVANAGGGVPQWGEPAYATVTGYGDVDTSPVIVRRSGDAALAFGNTDGEIYLFSALARDGSGVDYSLTYRDAYTDASGDGAVSGVGVSNYYTSGGGDNNWVVWSTDTMVHGIKIGPDGRFDDASYWSQSVTTPSKPLVLQYGGNTYAYVGTGTGYVFELDCRDGGTITGQHFLESGTTVGDVTIDTGAGPGSPATQGFVGGTTSGRIYWVGLD